MTPDDLARLHTRGFTQSRPWRAEEFESLLASPTTFLVALENAFALGRTMAGEAELLTIVTDPAHRRTGLGTACLLGFEATARDRHATTAFLEVAADNPAAQALYAKAAYTEAGRRPAYYPRPDGPAADALLLTKRL